MREAVGMMSGAWLLAKALKREGVTKGFGLVGDHVNAIFFACQELGIEIVGTRHEAAAAHMADGFARVTGRPGVVIATGGPGHINALTGIATAYLAGSPVIFFSGCPETSQVDRDTFQELDQVALARPITKWARAVSDARRIPEYVATAFREALSGRPGPVHLSIPINVSMQEVEESEVPFPPPERYRPRSRPLGEPKLIKRAIQILHEAERPIVVAGSGVFWSQAHEPLQRFIELTKIPLFTIDLARGIVSDLHPYCFGYADPILNQTAKEFAKTDVALVLGKGFDFRLGYGRAFDESAKIIQIDISQEELGKNREVKIGIVADPKAALEQLVALAEGLTWQRRPWLTHLETVDWAWREGLKPYEHSNAIPIHPLRLCREIREILDDDAIIVIDAGDFVQWPRITLPARRGGHWLRTGPLGTLGVSIPFGLAAKLAKPDKQVLIFIGDGGFGFYGFELQTAARYRLPIVIIIGNDQGWGFERQLQMALYGKERVTGCELGMVSYDKVVEALGGHGKRIERPEEIRPALELALSSGLPACLNVMIEPVISPLAEAAIAKYRR